MVKANFSPNVAAIKSRIKRLPQMYDDTVSALQKGDADRLVKYFRDGILNKSLRLSRLSDYTVASKIKRGAKFPETPLYMRGPDEEDSYANMMVVDELKKGKGKLWVVHPRDDKHHESDLTLRSLFVVHEYGTIINNAFGRGIQVRIPPRPAMRYAYRKLMRERAQRDSAGEVKKAVAKYVRDNDQRALKLIKERSKG